MKREKKFELYTEEEILREILDCYEKNNKVINTRIYGKEGRLPSVPTIRSYFGSWEQALLKAGIKEDMMYRRFTKEDMLKEIQSCALQNRGAISKKIYDSSNRVPRAETIANTFGTWNNAVKEAGLIPHKGPYASRVS